MTKICSVDFALFQKRYFSPTENSTLQLFPKRTFYLKWHTDCCMHAKNQDRSPSKILR